TGYSLNGIASAAALRDRVGGGPGAKLVAILRVHGAPADVPGLTELVEDAERDGWHVVVISGVGAGVAGGAAEPDGVVFPRTLHVSARLAADLTAYFMAGGVVNITQALRRVANDLLGIPAAFAPPQEMPSHGLYHPDLLVTSVAEWDSYRSPNKPLAP